METTVRKNGAAPAARRARKQLRRRMTWALIAVVVLGGAGYWWKTRNQAADTGPKDLQTAKAFRTTLLETVSATGSVTSQTGAQIKIGSQITGRIKHLYADVGSHVRAGQLIAELDLPDIDAQVGSARASLGQAITHLQQTETSVGMQRSQTSDAVKSAMDALNAAETRERSAEAASTMQPTQTSSDIQRSVAALNTARATLHQVETSHDLQINTAKAAINQAQANVTNTVANLKREQELFKQGFVAASDVDTATSQEAVAQAQLDTARQNLSLTTAKADADVATARQQVAQAVAALNASKSGRFTDVMRQQDVINAQAAVREARAALNSAEAGLTANAMKQQDVQAGEEAVRQAEDQVRYQEAQLDKTFIRTPISGTVLQMAAQQGETLAAGLSAPTLIIVADLNRLQVDAFVDETDIGKVRLGQSATVTVDAYPDQRFSGKVIKIASGSTLQQNVVTYDVTIAIKDPEHQLKPDMTTSVTIAVGEHPNVVALPNEALKPDNKGGQYVWLQRAGAKEPIQQPVEIGATDGTYTEIKSGVEDGDTVVLAGWPPPEGPGGMRMTPFGMRPGGGGRRGR